MKKLVISILLATLVLSHLLATQIGKITSFSNGVKLFDYDFYNGTVTGINNRVFVQNFYNLVEFEFTEDEGLNRLISLDTIFSNSLETKINIYQDRLWVYNYHENQNGTRNYFFRVFDLSQIPMKEIMEFDTPEIQTSMTPTVNFENSYIYITFHLADHSEATVRYHIDNYSFVDFVQPSLLCDSIIKDGLLIELNRMSLIFSEFKDDQKTMLSSVDLPLSNDNYILNIDLYSEIVVITHTDGVVLIDISDILYPTLKANVKMPVGETNFARSAVIYEDFLFISNELAQLFIYQLNSDEEYILIDVKTDGGIGSFASLYIKNHYLFHKRGIDIIVYDMNKTTIEQSHIYSKVAASPLMKINPQQNDFYYLEKVNYSNYYDIYSILENSLIVRVVHDDLLLPSEPMINQFHIDNNKLYALYFQDSQYFLNIYDIENKEAKLKSKTSLPNFTISFLLISNDQILVDYQNSINIYDINNDMLILSGSISGTLQTTIFGTNLEGLVVTKQNDEIIFREKTNLHNITNRIMLPYQRGIGVLCIINEYYLFAVQNRSQTSFIQYADIFNFNLEDNSITKLHDLPQGLTYSIWPFNNIITDSAFNKKKSEFYSILDNKFIFIGEKEEKDSEGITNFFYPEKNKMIKITQSSIWVYDFEFDEYVTDSDIVAETRPTGLIGNYPNPFNPETVIKFRIENLELGKDSSHSSGLPHYAVGGAGIHARIDIYNIKGQKVRSLVNSYYPAGEHSVVWNGKDDNGVGVGSGVYFYRMQTVNYTETRKMLLIK